MDMYLFNNILLIALLGTVEGQEECHAGSGTKTLKAYYNWPISFDCATFATSECGLEGSYQCNITSKDTNETLLLITHDYDYDDYYGNGDLLFEIRNVTAESPTHIEILVQNEDDCCSQGFQLQKASYPDITCQQSHVNFSTTPSETYPDLLRRRSCTVTGANEPQLQSLGNYAITWYHDCGNLPIGVNTSANNEMIEILSFDPFKHPGIYSCAVEHNGEIRYIAEHHLCAKQRRPQAQVKIICNTDKIRYEIGDTATIECNVDVGSSETDARSFNMNFYPLLENQQRDISRDNTSCTATLGDASNPSASSSHISLDDRVSCQFNRVRRIDEICFLQIPTQEEWDREKNKTLQVLRMTFTIKDLQRYDFTAYEAFVSFNEPNNNDSDVVTILMDLGEQRRAALIGGILGGTVFLLILIACFLYCFRFQLRLMWKRSRFVKHEKGLDYGAYFTYFWSKEDGGDLANEKYTDLISGMRSFVTKLGFNIYDPSKDLALCQWSIQNAQEVQQSCDRIIVILTSKFLEQNTAEHELYENFLEKAFILIKTPDFEAAFKNLERDRRNGLLAHFQRNFTIRWSGEGGELSKRFQMELELAMPKVKREGFDDIESSRLSTRL